VRANQRKLHELYQVPQSDPDQAVNVVLRGWWRSVWHRLQRNRSRSGQRR